MPFSSSCHTISLQPQAHLHALCRKSTGDFVASSIDLNRYLANRNGEFYWRHSGGGFVSTAKDIRLEGAVLCASLVNDQDQPVPAHLNLNFCIVNVDGRLEFRKPDTHLASTCTCFRIDERHVFTALCLTDTGKLAVSQIDLDLHFSNDKGKFKTDGRDFSHAAKDVRLDGLILRASLTYKDKWVEASYNLNSCIENIDGELRFHKHDGFWDRDGAFSSFLENLTVVGYAVSGLDLLHGDEDEAKRAAAECTYMTILTASTVVASTFAGPLGIALAAALSTPFAIVSEDRIADRIHDPHLREQFPAETLDRFVSTMLVNFLATGAAPYLGRWVSEEAGLLMGKAVGAGVGQETVNGIGAQVVRNVSNAGGRAIGDQGVRTAFQTMHDSLIRLSAPVATSGPQSGGFWSFLWRALRFFRFS